MQDSISMLIVVHRKSFEVREKSSSSVVSTETMYKLAVYIVFVCWLSLCCLLFISSSRVMIRFLSAFLVAEAKCVLLNVVHQEHILRCSSQ